MRLKLEVVGNAKRATTGRSLSWDDVVTMARDDLLGGDGLVTDEERQALGYGTGMPIKPVPAPPVSVVPPSAPVVAPSIVS